jgi:hypothetical protein
MANRAHKACLVSKVHREWQDSKVSAHKDHREPLDLQACRDNRELRGQEDFKECKGHREFKGHRG